MTSVVHLHGRPQGPGPSAGGSRPLELAGAKKLALLRSWICAVDPRGHAVLVALFGPDAGSRLADGSLEIPAHLADALIKVCANLPLAIVPDDGRAA